jgi:hypothetical protein
MLSYAPLWRERNTRHYKRQNLLSEGLLDKLLWRPLECFFRFNHQEMNASHHVFLREVKTWQSTRRSVRAS